MKRVQKKLNKILASGYKFLASDKPIALDCSILLAFLCIFYLFRLGAYSLQVPDEARYVDIALEMLRRDSLIVPTLQGLVYLEKPALVYWLEAGTMALFGFSEFVARLPIFVFSSLTVLATYVTTRQLFSRQHALLASFICATGSLFYLLAHVVTLDMPLTFFVTAACFSFLLAYQKYHEGKSASVFLMLMYFCIALGVLTKGLVAVLIPGAVVFIWCVWTKNLRFLFRLHLLWGAILVFSICFPWHWWVQQEEPSFFQFYFIEQHFLRYLTGVAKHEEFIGYYFLVLFVGFFPWSLLIPSTLKHTLKNTIPADEKRYVLFMYLFAGFVFIFFTLSKSKLLTYILPMIAPLSICIAYGLLSRRAKLNVKLYTVAVISMLLVSVVVSVFAFTSSAVPFQYSQTTILLLSGLLFFLAAMLLYIKNYLQTAIAGFSVLAGVSFFTTWCFVLCWPTIEYKTSKPLVAVLKQYLQKDDAVILFNSNEYDATVYLGFQPYLAGPIHGELKQPFVRDSDVIRISSLSSFFEQARSQPDGHTRVIADQDLLWQIWRTNQRVFLFARRKDVPNFYEHPKRYEVAKTKSFVLLSNQEVVG